MGSSLDNIPGPPADSFMTGKSLAGSSPGIIDGTISNYRNVQKILQ